MGFGVALIGAGYVGRKRAKVVQADKACDLKAVVDVDIQTARDLADECGGEAFQEYKRILNDEDIDIVIVATVHKYLAPISLAALESGKHVLCEKPLGFTPQESERLIKEAQARSVTLKTGFNHRHHPALMKAKEILKSGAIGQLAFLRCRYGHGGRPGYEQEWRADKNFSGGGELLDQGVHVADLFRWFAGDFSEAFGYTATRVWDMKVEDNAFALFKTKDGVVASLQTSWTQWKNLFSFEIFGTDGYLNVEGLGGSYGTETLRQGRRNPKGGVPSEKVYEFSGKDTSWKEEWEEFKKAILERRDPMGSGTDGYEANRMVAAVYQSARTGKAVML